MKHSIKYLVCACMVGASFVACCLQPITASAISVSVDDQAAIDDYFNAYGQNQGLIELNYNYDQDGNKSVHLQIMGMQRLALEEQLGIYENMDFDAAPSTVTISGTGFSGVYTSYRDNKKHFASSQFIANDGVFVSSDEFNVQVSHVSHGYGGRFNSNSSPSSGGYSFTTLADPYNRSVSWTISDSNNYFTSSGTYSQSQNTTQGRYAAFNGSPDTVLPASLLSGFSSSSSLNFGGSGVSYNLPNGDPDTLTPWDYYNNFLLPYLRQNYNIDDIDDFLVFPHGYPEDDQPKNSTIPIEYPTAPTFDLGLDESGTQPTGMESLNYILPPIETKTVGIPAFDLTSLNPSQIMLPVSNGLSGLWALVSDLLGTFELFPLVSLALLVAVVGGLLLLGR